MWWVLLFLIAWGPAQFIDRTACPRHRTYRAHRCVPPADSHPDQAGPKGNGQGRGAGQVVDCICIGFVYSFTIHSTAPRIYSCFGKCVEQGTPAGKP